jgi:hypothetical protein
MHVAAAGAAKRRSRTITAGRRVVLLTLCLAFAPAGCGEKPKSDVAGPQQAGSRRSEAPLSVTVEQRSGLIRASVVTAGESMYVGVGTFGKDRFSMFRVSASGRVQPLPSVQQVRSGVPAGSMAAWNGSPCVATSDGRRPDVSCLDDGRWISQQVPTGVDGWAIQQLLTVGPTMYVLLIDPRQASRGLITAREGSTWTPYFSVPSGDREAIWYLGGSTANRSDQLVIGSVSSRVREVFSRQGSDWTRIAQAPMSGLPNQNSGPVLTASNVLFSRSLIKSQRWPFYVDTSQPGGKLQPASRSLSKPGTASQGRLVVAQGQPWVSWEEAQVTRRPDALRKVFAARLDDMGRVRERFHVGTFRSVIASWLDVVAVGKDVFALTTSSSGAPPYRATVKLVRLRS